MFWSLQTAKDRNFLIFDLDRPEILQRLEAIPDATIIATNPCFELWYLLHYTARKAALTTHGNPSTDVPQFIAALVTPCSGGARSFACKVRCVKIAVK